MSKVVLVTDAYGNKSFFEQAKNKVNKLLKKYIQEILKGANKMNKVSYRKYYGKDGTVYNQSIRIDFNDFQKILKEIIKEKQNKYINYKKYCAQGVNYANIFLMHPNESKKEYLDNYTLYCLNLTTTNFIKYILKNKRILNRNTVLIYDYRLDK